jgi:transposase InsO family protein
MVVVDRITKLRYYIPCHAEKGNLNFKHVIKLFLRYIWKHHGLPNLIVSDRGSMFVSYLWNSLCKLLGIKQKLSTAFHLKNDGQIKAANKEIERYLRTYIDHL